MGHSGAGNPCDVAPSRFKRFERDGYITLDADWIILALCCAVQVEGPILEPCAGRGHMVRELRARICCARCRSLHAHRFAGPRHKDRRRRPSGLTCRHGAVRLSCRRRCFLLGVPM
jgi:hypothetical protein